MDPQLLAKIRQRRQKQQGFQPQEKQKEQEKKPSPPKKNSAFQQRRRMLQANLYKKNTGPTTQKEQPIKKQQIKGNQAAFNNAREQLEAQLNKNSSGSGSSSSTLPNLPPPPPPPPNINLNKITNLTLPPPPPPPNLSNLLPPPNLNNLLPPPQQPTVQINNNIKPPPPPPPPVQINNNNTQPPPPPVKINITQPPPPPPPPVKINNNTQPPPPPPPPTPPMRTQTEKRTTQYVQNPSYRETQAKNPITNIENPYNSNSQTSQNKGFNMNRGQQKSQRRQTRRSTRQQIFNQGQKGQNVTAQFFGKDIAAFVKKQFIRQTDILDVIGTRVTKKLYNFNFPSIQHNLRDIEPIQTLYADSSNLDVVSCYMQKNMNAIKPHNDARDSFKNAYKNYNWNTDPLKLKSIKELAQNVPHASFRQPNFVQIKNGLNRCDNLIKSFLKYQNYTACAQVKKLREQADKLIQTYCKNPQGNQALYDQLQIKLQQIKDTKM